MQQLKGRKPIQLDPAEFQALINRLEANSGFSSLQELWRAVEQTEWARSRQPRPLTAQVARLRAKELGITAKTQRGVLAPKSGRGGKRKRHADASAITALRMATPPSLSNVVDRVAAGSLKAAVKLMCLDCTAQQPREVRSCTIKKCPLWSFRPYKEDQCPGTIT